MEAQRRRRIEWQHLIDELKSSGLTQREFATRRGLNAKTLENWTYRLRREARGMAARAPFLPVRVRAAGPAPSGMPGGGIIEVAVGDGLRVRFAPGVDCEYVGRLLATVVRSAAC